MANLKNKLSPIEIVNQKILDYIEECKENGGVPPWQKSWIVVYKQNGESHRHYGALNRLLLSGDSDEFYYTWNAIEKLGGNVKPGHEKDYRLVISIFLKYDRDYVEGEDLKPWEKKEYDNILKKYVVKKWGEKYHRVYPSSLIEGIEAPSVGERDNQKDENIEAFIERIKKDFGLNLHEAGSQPHYNPSANFIEVPSIKRFYSSEEYYQAFFHELAHWTGHKDRLNRELVPYQVNKEKYAREELVAEICSAYICHYFGIDLIQNSASYLDSWSQAIKDDKCLLKLASAKAEKVLEYFGLV